MLPLASTQDQEKPPPPPPPPSPMIWHRWVGRELKKQQAIVVPLAAMNLTWFAKIVVTTVFLGRLGEAELAGGALGLTFANVTGFSVLTGLCCAMEPICGQAFGAGNQTLMRRTLLMTTVLLLVVSVPVSALWLNVGRIMEAFGQNSDITALSKAYVLYLLPDLVVTSFLCPLKAYLSSQGLTVPIFLSSVLALALHLPLNVLLSRARGIHGVAMAVWLSDFVAVIVLAMHVLFTERNKGDGEDSSSRSRHGHHLHRLLRLAGPCCLTTCLEWWCYEILVLVTGRLPDAKRMVAVLAVVLNFDYLLYSIMLSLATCASTRVSNELGAGRAASARAAALASLGLGMVLGCVGGATMAAAGRPWGRLFSHDGGVVGGVRKAMLLMSAVEVVNFPLSVCGGVVRGTARPKLGMYATLGGFYLVALPLGVTMAFQVELGLEGLLLGFLAGATTAVLVLLVLVGRIDWDLEAQNAQQLAGKEAVEQQDDDDDNDDK